jgi:hypothetical protein
MALAVARDPFSANRPLTIASAIAARRASGSEEPARPRRLPAPASKPPAQSRIVLRGNTVCYR